MLRLARTTLAIAIAGFAVANCRDTRGLVGPAPVVATLTLSGAPSDGVMLVGATLSLAASARDATGQALAGKPVAWSTSDAAVATVSSNGVVTAISAGGAMIRATSDGVFDTATLSVREGFAPPPPAATAPVVQTALGGRVTMSIPPGAVPAGIAQLTVGPAATPTASVQLVNGTAFEFGPSGTQFSTPLTLTIRFDPASVAAADRAGLAIYHAVGGAYEAVYGSVVGSDHNEVSAPISSFSSYAILRRDSPVSLVMAAGNNQSASAGTAVQVRPAVRLADASGRAVSFATVSFAVASGGGSLTGATQISDNDGAATVGSWTLGSAAGANTLTATVSGLPPVTFTAMALAAAPVQLVVTAQPGSATAGATLSPLVVTAEDALGNPATSFTGAVMVALGANPGGATLGGTTTVTAVAGVARFADLSVNRAGAGYALVATSTALTAATSAAFDITIGAASRLVFTQSPSSAVAGASLGAVQVSAEDVAGNVTPAYTGAVRVALGSNPGAAELGGPSSANAVAGVATFGSLSVDRTGRAYTLVASAGGLASGTSVPFDITPSPVPRLALIGGGGQTALASTLLAQPIVVQVLDAAGNASAGRTVTFAVTGGGGSVAPGSGATDASGMVSTSWTLGALVGSQSITVSSAGVGAVTVTATATAASAGPSVLSLVSGGAQSATAGTMLAPITVKVSDASGNPIAGGTVTFAVTTGGGSVAPSSGTTDAQGLMTTTWTLGPTPGAQTMTASASSTPNVLTIGATATSAPLPSLHFYDSYYDYWYPSIGIGQYRFSGVATDAPVQSALTVTFSHTGATHTGLPASVTIAAGDYVGGFTLSGTSAGVDALVLTAPGYRPLTASIVVDMGLIGVYGPTSLKVQDSTVVNIWINDPTGAYADGVVSATTFTLAPNANVQAVSGGATSAAISSVTIPAGDYGAQFWLKGIAPGTGSVTITSSTYKPGGFSLTVAP
ncbi:MAG: beta strand repeat-containing protein [Gemmatimonadales bacterium]